MSSPDPADALVARSADRIALAAMRKDSAAALELVLDLYEHRADVTIVLRTESHGGAPAPVDRTRRPMPAKYPGRCTICAAAVQVGDQIYYDSGRPTHARCA